MVLRREDERSKTGKHLEKKFSVNQMSEKMNRIMEP